MTQLEQLVELGEEQNNGRGVSCIRSVIFTLHRNQLEEATAIICNEWDKISSYHQIANILKEMELAKENWYVTKMVG